MCQNAVIKQSFTINTGILFPFMFNIFLRHWVLARPILSTFNVNVAPENKTFAHPWSTRYSVGQFQRKKKESGGRRYGAVFSRFFVWLQLKASLSRTSVKCWHWLCYTYPQTFSWAPPAGFHWAPVHQQTKTASSEPPTVASMWARAVFQRMTGSVRSNIMRKKKKWKKKKKEKRKVSEASTADKCGVPSRKHMQRASNMLHTNAHVSENDMLAYNPESRVSPFVTRTITKQRFQGENYQVTDLRLTLNSSKVH